MTQHHRLRAQAVVDAHDAAPVTEFRVGQKRVSIIDGPRLDGDHLVLSVRVMRGGKDVTPPALDPIRIVNPPTMVPDDAGDVVLEGGVGPDGQRLPDRRYRKAPAEALRAIIADLVR